MSKIFDSVTFNLPDRNSFDLSFSNTFSAQIGKLVPILCKHCVPGDSFHMSNEGFIRFAPMVSPVMTQFNAFVHYFFVPYRILMDFKYFEKVSTGGKKGNYDGVFPSITFQALFDVMHDPNKAQLFGEGQLSDYLGLNGNHQEISDWLERNIDAGQGQRRISLLPFLGYQRIYSDYYRDQNLDTVEYPEWHEADNVLSGADFLDKWASDTLNSDGDTSAIDIFKLRSRAYAKDYFTSALPQPQRGQDVTIPLEGQAPVYSEAGNRTLLDQFNLQNPTLQPNSGATRTTMTSDNQGVYAGTGATTPSSITGINQSTGFVQFKDGTKIGNADLSAVSAVTVTALRYAVKLQEFLEKNARAGGRYIEQVLAHFGVRSDDASMKRAEYLGGNRFPIQISEVLQESQTTSDSVLGDMGGHAVGASSSDTFHSGQIKEHGMIFAIMSVVPKPTYFQGLHRTWNILDRYDLFQHEFEHVGEQEVYTEELLLSGQATPKKVFGYAPRYSEYKSSNNEIHGKFKTNLNHWVATRKFLVEPTLNDSFVSVQQSDYSNIFAVPSAEENIYCQFYHHISAQRLMSQYSNPMF